MSILVSAMLAACVAISSVCFVETVKVYTEKKQFQLKEDGTVHICLLQVFRQVLSGRAKIRLSLLTAALYFFALLNIAGAVSCNFLISGSYQLPVSAGLLAFSALLMLLTGKYIGHVRYLLLCCAAKAYSEMVKRQKKTVANSNDLQ